MLRYITLGSNNRVAARAFYDRVLAPLGLTATYADEEMVGYGPDRPGDSARLWICDPYNRAPATVGNGSMVALQAATRAQVDAVHAEALAAGGQDEGAPGLRPYSPDFYAAYFRDLDGNKLAVVCQAPAEPLASHSPEGGPRIVRIEKPDGRTPVLDQPREDRRVTGAPWRQTWTHHEAGPMSAGIWACEVGRWRIAFPAHKQEYFFVLEGLVRLHGPGAEVQEIGPGQAAVIPPGFEGEFEVVTPVRKHFVVVDLPQ